MFHFCWGLVSFVAKDPPFLSPNSTVWWPSSLLSRCFPVTSQRLSVFSRTNGPAMIFIAIRCGTYMGAFSQQENHIPCCSNPKSIKLTHIDTILFGGNYCTSFASIVSSVAIFFQTSSRITTTPRRCTEQTSPNLQPMLRLREPRPGIFALLKCPSKANDQTVFGYTTMMRKSHLRS